MEKNYDYVFTDAKGSSGDLDFFYEQIDIGIKNTEILKNLTEKEVGLYRLKLYNDIQPLVPKDENTVTLEELKKEWLDLEKKLQNLENKVQ